MDAGNMKAQTFQTTGLAAQSATPQDLNHTPKTKQKRKVDMTEQEQIIELAKLDGWTSHVNEVHPSAHVHFTRTSEHAKVSDFNYLTSRDAIVPLIKKLFNADWALGNKLFDALWKIHAHPEIDSVDLTDVYNTNAQITTQLICSTPAQLSEALLRATNNWKE